MLLRLHQRGLTISNLWVPAHVGVQRDEKADILAKQSLKQTTIDIQVPLYEAEIKTNINKHSHKTCQEHLDLNDTERHLCKTLNDVGTAR